MANSGPVNNDFGAKPWSAASPRRVELFQVSSEINVMHEWGEITVTGWGGGKDMCGEIPPTDDRNTAGRGRTGQKDFGAKPMQCGFAPKRCHAVP